MDGFRDAQVFLELMVPTLGLKSDDWRGGKPKKRLIFREVYGIQVFINKGVRNDNGQRDKGIFGEDIAGPDH